MAGQWKEVVRLPFRGLRFRDHAFDLSALSELSQFQKMVAETAKVLWRASHPDRDRLPARFEDRTRLCLRRIEEGSAVAPLEVYIEEPEEPELFEREAPKEVRDAVDLVQAVYQALEKDEPLPPKFPRSLVPEYERWGQTLAEDEAIEVIAPGKATVRVTPLLRQRLAAYQEPSHEDEVDIVGEVLEADVRQRRFQLWLDEKTSCTVAFLPEQEEEVTTALRDHKTLRLGLTGRGEFSPEGKILRVSAVRTLRVKSLGEEPYDSAVPPIEDVLQDLARGIPKEDWRRLPADLTDDIDRYVYGTPNP